MQRHGKGLCSIMNLIEGSARQWILFKLSGVGEGLGKMASDESKIQQSGIDFCKGSPIVKRIFRTQSGLVRVKGGGMLHLCPKGTPDTTGFTVDGKIIAIEYKTKDAFEKKDHGANEDQIRYLVDVVEAGGLAGIACCDIHVKMILEGAPIGLESYLSVADDKEQLDLISQ